MNEEQYRVHVVVDPEYGERLRDLPVGEPVWVVDSERNHPVIRALWREHEGLDESAGITSFTFNRGGTCEDWLVAELSTIDLHHGEFSHDPPYSVLNVIGVGWSRAIQEELDRFGFGGHEATGDGFVARRLRSAQGDGS